MSLSLSHAARTHVGIVRDKNQDSWMARPDDGLFVVADGMGGHAAGEVASALAIEVLESRLDGLGSGGAEERHQQMAEAIVEAGRRIFRQGEDDPDQKGMGTTATVLYLRPESYLLGHVGDSRAYRMRDDELVQLTEDHTPHPNSSVLTRALGTGDRTEPDLFEGEVREGDLFLLCSDGLTDMVSDDLIGPVLAGEGGLDPDAEGGEGGAAGDERLVEMAETLVGGALENGGRDNVTVLLVRVESTG